MRKNLIIVHPIPMTKKIIHSCAIVIVVLLLSACKNNTIFSKYETFTENEWAAKNKVTFKVPVTDSVNLHNIYIMVRHAESYPYSNIFLFVSTKYPNGKTLSDTMELILANQKGQWLGDGAGDIYDYKVPVKKNIRFAQSGTYEFSFEQGMRVDPLPLIMDLGFEIEKSE
jgi:gliding motility-associated lipoprotein GldH